MVEKQKSEQSSNWFLYLIVFTSGMTTLAVEISASRLLGFVFGTSNIVWANVIGLMLLYLTIGYYIGGRWADRSPYTKTLFQIVVWGAFLSALIPLIARPILQFAGASVAGLQAGLALGSFLSVLALFSIPVTLLGTVSPFAIRLAVTSVESAGKVSGQIYGLSTIGSLIGTFLPTLILIPKIGTTLTFLLFAGLLYLVGFWGSIRENWRSAIKVVWMPIVIIVLTAILLGGALRPPQEGERLFFESESAYNYIQVTEDENQYRYLYLNEGQGIHSQWHPTQIAYQRTWDFFLTAPYFNTPPVVPEDVDSLLVVGLATGTIPRQYIHVYGDIHIDGVEIDPEIVRAGELYFDMNKEMMPSLNVYVEDGRYILNQLDRTYDVIGIDAYRPPYIPWHLTTVEFFREVRSHLNNDGVMVINVGRTNTDRRLVDALTNTLEFVFPSIHAMDVPYSFNTILVATMQPTTTANLVDNLVALPPDANPILRDTLAIAQASVVPTNTNDIIFTDDRAPVETLVDSIVLNFFLTGGIEDLR